MNGLLYKDLLNLSPTMKYLAFMALIFCVVFIPMGNELPVYIILIMFGAMLPTTEQRSVLIRPHGGISTQQVCP